jgi:hypothetical protein
MFTKKRQVRLPTVRRRAGESLSEERERRVYDKLPLIIFSPFIFWFAYLTQLLQQWNHTGPQPRLWLWIAIVATLGSAIWLWRLFPIARRFNRGERGERHVADVLEELRAMATNQSTISSAKISTSTTSLWDPPVCSRSKRSFAPVRAKSLFGKVKP